MATPVIAKSSQTPATIDTANSSYVGRFIRWSNNSFSGKIIKTTAWATGAVGFGTLSTAFAVRAIAFGVFALTCGMGAPVVIPMLVNCVFLTYCGTISFSFAKRCLQRAITNLPTS